MTDIVEGEELSKADLGLVTLTKKRLYTKSVVELFLSHKATQLT